MVLCRFWKSLRWAAPLMPDGHSDRGPNQGRSERTWGPRGSSVSQDCHSVCRSQFMSPYRAMMHRRAHSGAAAMARALMDSTEADRIPVPWTPAREVSAPSRRTSPGVVALQNPGMVVVRSEAGRGREQFPTPVVEDLWRLKTSRS